MMNNIAKCILKFTNFNKSQWVTCLCIVLLDLLYYLKMDKFIALTTCTCHVGTLGSFFIFHSKILEGSEGFLFVLF